MRPEGPPRLSFAVALDGREAPPLSASASRWMSFVRILRGRRVQSLDT